MPADIDKAIPHYCINNAGIFTLVADRIHPNRLPQNGVIPAVTFENISTTAIQSHREASFLPIQRFQFTYYGVTYDICKQIAKAFKNALDGYKGNWGAGSFVTVVQACLFKDERSIDDPETGLYWRQQDYIIIWKE